MLPKYEPTPDDRLGVREEGERVEREWENVTPQLKRFDPDFAREAEMHELIAQYGIAALVLPMLGIAVGVAAESTLALWISLILAVPAALVIAWSAGTYERRRKQVFFAYVEAQRVPNQTPNKAPEPTTGSVTPRAPSSTPK